MKISILKDGVKLTTSDQVSVVNFPGCLLFESCNMTIGGRPVFEEYDRSCHGTYINFMTQMTEEEKENFCNQFGYSMDTIGNADSNDVKLDKPCRCSCNR